jgi:nicotinamide mononucleotide adenylyltransferase
MADAWEAEQPRYSRTLHVLRSVQGRLAAMIERDSAGGRAPPAPRVMLVCGADVLCSMADPGVWQQELLEVGGV